MALPSWHATKSHTRCPPIVNLKYIRIGTILTLPSSIDVQSIPYRVAEITPLIKSKKQSQPDLERGMEGLTVDGTTAHFAELFVMSWKTTVSIGGLDKEDGHRNDENTRVRAGGVSEVC